MNILPFPTRALAIQQAMDDADLYGQGYVRITHNGAGFRFERVHPDIAALPVRLQGAAMERAQEMWGLNSDE